MAIDLMVMPLSRYWAGDYITPVMRQAWASGATYFIFGPEGKKELPPDQPYGGETAAADRLDLLATVVANLKSSFAEQGVATVWDEHYTGEIGFHRLDTASVAALEKAANERLDQPNAPRHFVKSNIYLPIRFEDPLRWGDIVFGSLPALALELAAEWPEEAKAAVATFRDAIAEARSLNLPLIVDS